MAIQVKLKVSSDGYTVFVADVPFDRGEVIVAPSGTNIAMYKEKTAQFENGGLEELANIPPTDYISEATGLPFADAAAVWAFVGLNFFLDKPIAQCISVKKDVGEKFLTIAFGAFFKDVHPVGTLKIRRKATFFEVVDLNGRAIVSDHFNNFVDAGGAKFVDPETLETYLIENLYPA
jgi:hypothetical protein